VLAPLAVSLAYAAPPGPAGTPDWSQAGLERDATGTLVRVFGLEPDVAAEVLLPATHQDTLPDGYQPADLVLAAMHGIPTVGAQRIRGLIADDTQALVQAAAQLGHDLYVGSGFRSQAEQVAIFAAQVRRWGDTETANRYSAQPGHSQHQLGTTIDFTLDFRAFRGSDAAAWLRDNAHRYGFILPYTAAAAERTGYVDEPWHARWVGRPLAAALQSAGYQAWTDADADDALTWLRTAANFDG
jgi:D-alanyl-D-alanine carboxypeptidase